MSENAEKLHEDLSEAESIAEDEVQEEFTEEKQEATGEDVENAEETAEEEIEETARRHKEEEEKFVEERIYTIPLRRAWIMPPKKRASKAIRIIRAFIQQHMKVGEATIETEAGEKEGNKIIISNEVNERIWKRGIENPPRRLRIRAAKDEDGNVTIFLA